MDFLYSTRPTDEELRAWHRGLEPAVQKFLIEHSVQVPFWFHGYPGRYADGAIANLDTQQWCKEYPTIWTEAGQRKRPTMRWEFEMLVAFGGLEVLDWAKNKDWGPLEWVAPLLPDDPVDPVYLSCRHNPATSKWHRRRNQRLWIRHALPKGQKDLYGLAMRSTKGDFVGTLESGRVAMRWVEGKSFSPTDESATVENIRCVKLRSDGARIMKAVKIVTPEQDKARLIRHTFNMSAAEFWDACRCKTMLSERRMYPQLKLF